MELEKVKFRFVYKPKIQLWLTDKNNQETEISNWDKGHRAGYIFRCFSSEKEYLHIAINLEKIEFWAKLVQGEADNIIEKHYSWKTPRVNEQYEYLTEFKQFQEMMKNESNEWVKVEKPKKTVRKSKKETK